MAKDKPMKKLNEVTVLAIDQELKNIPDKYQKNFNSTHEGYAVILEEVRELEQEVFFGEKVIKEKYKGHTHFEIVVDQEHKERMREECIQIAAMCARFIQELT